MENTILNTDLHTYLIKFRFQTTNSRFIVQGSGLMNCLKTYDRNGVEYIKIFDPVKARFERIARDKILQIFSWQTEEYEYLKNHYFFK